MSKGKVKYFNDLKGWGIIRHLADESDVYVHYTAIQMAGFKTLAQGQEVLFELVRTDNGPTANHVIPA
ncbi:MAG: cold shock domain-containing protein [bacterium]